MAKTTPEGEVKKMISRRLIARGLIPTSKAVNATYKHTGKFHMPVSNGMSVVGIPDYYGHYKGFYFEIEAKKDDKEEPTALQKHQLNATSVTDAAAFVVGSEKTMDAVETWMNKIDNDLDYAGD